MTGKQLKWQKRRCTFGVCRKPAIEGSEYCREHKEYMEERQCQR